MLRLLVIVVVLSFSVDVQAAGLSKSSSLTVENDPNNSSWTAICDISVGGVAPNQIYSGRVFFQFSPSGGGGTIIIDAFFQVDPVNRIWTESSPGIYKVRASLKGRDVTVHSEVTFSSINAGDRILCGPRIDPGIQPPPTGTTLFENHMVSTVQAP